MQAETPLKTATRNRVRTSAPSSFCANNGYAYLENAFAFLKAGGDTLDAAIKVVKGPEDDPNVRFGWLGGIPTKKAWSNLTPAACTGRRGGGIGGRRAQHQECGAGLEGRHGAHRPRHAGGEGAERFAVALGFPPRESAHRTLAQNLAALERISFTDDWWGPASPIRTGSLLQRRTKPQSELWQERIQNLQARAAELGIGARTSLARYAKVLFPPSGTILVPAERQRVRFPESPPPADSPSKLPDAAAIRPSLAAGLLHRIRTLARPGGNRSGEENIKSRGRIPSWKTCATACPRRRPV